MQLPDGVQFHGYGYRLGPGDEIPEDLLARLPADHPLKAPAPRAAPRSTPAKD